MNLLVYHLSSRKFILALIFSIASIVGLFTGKISDNSFIALAGGILSIYGYTNIRQKKDALQDDS